MRLTARVSVVNGARWIAAAGAFTELIWLRMCVAHYCRIYTQCDALHISNWTDRHYRNLYDSVFCSLRERVTLTVVCVRCAVCMLDWWQFNHMFCTCYSHLWVIVTPQRTQLFCVMRYTNHVGYCNQGLNITDTSLIFRASSSIDGFSSSILILSRAKRYWYVVLSSITNNIILIRQLYVYILFACMRCAVSVCMCLYACRTIGECAGLCASESIPQTDFLKLFSRATSVTHTLHTRVLFILIMRLLREHRRRFSLDSFSWLRSSLYIRSIFFSACGAAMLRMEQMASQNNKQICKCSWLACFCID